MVAALAVTATMLVTPVLAASANAAAGTGGAAMLPRQIDRGVEMTLADGDIFRLWASKDRRVVWSKRRDSTTHTWGVRTPVVKRPNLFCGDVEARTSNGAVAATVLCQKGGYAEDQAPTASLALWSSDTLTWRASRLPGEAYEEPGISPDGTRAVWPLHQRYVLRAPAGFSRHGLLAKRQGNAVTAVVDDNGRVSFLYTPPSSPSGLSLVSLSLSPSGPVERQVISLPGPGGDVRLENVDVDTVLFGDLDRVEEITAVHRTDTNAPWAVTDPAPGLAPGLVLQSTTGGRTDIFAATGLPLVALASGNNRRWTAQTYDETAQRWNARTTAFRSPRRCVRDPMAVQRPIDVVVDRIRCGRTRRLLVTTDATTWHAPLVGSHPVGVSPTRHWVSASNTSGTTVFSRARGAVGLALPVTGPCDVVVPTGPDSAMRVTAGRRTHDWPRLVQRSTASGWATVGRLGVRLPGTCRRARIDEDAGPAHYSLEGSTGVTAELRWVRRGGTLVPRLH